MSTEINLGGGGGGGVQGIQGIQGTAGTGSQGLFAQIYIAANISATAPNTNQLLQNFTLDQANAISLVNFAGTNDALQVTEAGRYKVNARFHSYNGDASSQDISIVCAVNGTFQLVSINNISNLQGGDVASSEFDIIVNLNAGDRVNFYWRTSSLNLELQRALFTSLGYSVVINMTNIAYVSQGIQGVQGSLGIQGTQGIQGLDGAFAAQGIQGTQGTQGIQGQIGTQGTTGTGIQGIQGIQGVQGTDGIQGATGTGTQGIQGTTGATGNTGAQGAQGITGIQGADGIQGSTGLQGATGTQGSVGSQGITGIQGADGIQGSVGLQGTQGIIGAQGIEGIQGATGIQGALGTQGATGLQGIQGLQGVQGAGVLGYFAEARSTGIIFSTPNIFSYISFVPAFLSNNGFVFATQGVPDDSVQNLVAGTYLITARASFTNLGATAGRGQFIILRNATQTISANQTVTINGGEVAEVFVSCIVTLNANENISIGGLVTNTGIAINGTVISGANSAINFTISNIANVLQGTQGIQGVQGPQGIQGLDGAFAAQGIQGIQGITGIQGATGNAGIQGIQGTEGIQGATGIQGTTGLQGVQGLQGTTGIQGETGIQGIQGITGATGNTGLQGIQGITGIQGNTGTQGVQGLQGIQGVGNVGAQGTQGLQGIQGVQGIQGLQGDSGVVGYFYSAYDTTGQTVAAINTQTIINFNNNYGSNSVSLVGSNLFRINEPAVYKVQLEVQWRNSDVTNVTTGKIYAIINSTPQVGTTVRTKVEPSGGQSATLEFTQSFTAGDTIEFAFEVDDTDLSLGTIAASGSAPTGASAFANIAQVARTLAPLDGNIKLNWTTGYVNLTNGVDNQIPFNATIYNVGAALSASNLSTGNAGIQFLYTGVYLFVVRAHLFDLGSNMTLSTTLYTSTNGTVWTLNTIIGLRRYTGTNTNQIQNSTFTLRVTSLPFYIQPRLNPSANAPFPADLSAPTAFIVTRVGDL
jgi:hypothetical protein